VATTTVYDVKIRYMLDDKASRALAGIGKAAEKAQKGTSRLDKTFKRIALGAAGFLSFRLGKKLLIDYNAELEQARIQMGGMLQLNMGGTWAENQKRANQLVRQFTQDAKKSTATTQDFVGFASLVTGPLARAGASMKQIRDITKGGVIAAKAFGIAGEFAARDIEQALVGTLGKKDRFARALIEPMGLTTKMWNKMVTETPGKAAQMLTDAFAQPAIQNMAKEQEKSWSGVTSTLKDNLQRAFGKIGLPLMKRIGAEMAKLNKWFDENPKKVAALIDTMANGLVKAFELAKRIFGFVVEHKTLLLALAKAYLVGKAVSGIVGGLAGGLGAVGNLGKLFAGVKGPMGLFSGGLLKVVGKLGVLSGVLAGAAVAIDGFFDYLGERATKEADRRGKVATVRARAVAMRGFDVKGGRRVGLTSQQKQEQKIQQRLAKSEGFMNIRNLATAGEQRQAKSLIRQSTEMGFVANGKVQAKKVFGAFGNDKSGALAVISQLEKALQLDRQTTAVMDKYHRQQLERQFDQTFTNLDGNLKRTVELFRINNDRFLVSWLAAKKSGDGNLVKTFVDYWKSSMGFFDEDRRKAAAEKKAKAKGKKTTNVKISKIEVISDDPDRFAMNLIGAFDDFASSPTQAANAIKES